MVRDFCRRGLVPGAFKDATKRWKVPEMSEAPGLPPRRVDLGEERRRKIARLGHEGANRTELAKDYGISRVHVYHLMGKYPPEESA